MKIVLATLAFLCIPAAQAATPAELLAGYRAEAVKQSPGYKPSADAGAHLYSQHFTASGKMPSCVSCHTNEPTRPGRHAVTDKAIKPLSPAANAERFTDPAKVEKWFKRNCKDVFDRECTAREKGDVITWLRSLTR